MNDDLPKKIIVERRSRAAKAVRILKKLFSDPKIALNYSNNWELLVAVELSAQCTDRKVNEVTEKLFRKYGRLNDYVNAKQRDFEKDIYQCGFYRAKARNILAAARMVKSKFNGKLPRTMKEMITIPGIGRKSANVILGNAYGVVEGIAVDTHVRRLSRQLGFTKNTDPVKIERDLMQIVPKKDWFDVTYLLIDYGRKYCPARQHDHARKGCPLEKFYV